MSEQKTLKQRIFNTIQIGNKDDVISRVFDYFIVVVIILNISVMLLETFDELAPAFSAFKMIEIITMWIFVVEYALRIWTADLLYPEKSRGQAVRHFLHSYDGIIDLLTILPFFFLSGFVAFRMLRVVRIFHLFRINTQYDSFNVITRVLYEKRNQIFSAIFILLTLMLASSIGVYSAEHEAQPEAFRNAFSGIWWSVSALLTVGYGDIYPITVAGKIMAIITAFLGVGVVAIPTGIISAGFVEQYREMSYQKKEVAADKGELPTRMLEVSEENDLVGKTIRDLGSPQGDIPVLVIRAADTLLAEPHTVLQAGDIVVLHNT